MVISLVRSPMKFHACLGEASPNCQTTARCLRGVVTRGSTPRQPGGVDRSHGWFNARRPKARTRSEWVVAGLAGDAEALCRRCRRSSSSGWCLLMRLGAGCTASVAFSRHPVCNKARRASFVIRASSVPHSHRGAPPARRHDVRTATNGSCLRCGSCQPSKLVPQTSSAGPTDDSASSLAPQQQERCPHDGPTMQWYGTRRGW